MDVSNAKLKRLEKAWNLQPKSRRFLPLAEAYREVGNLERSAEVFRLGLESYPDDVRGRVGLARALYLLGRLDEAEEQLHLVLSLKPEYRMARELLVTVYESESLFEMAAAEQKTLQRYHSKAQKNRARLGNSTHTNKPKYTGQESIQ